MQIINQYQLNNCLIELYNYARFFEMILYRAAKNMIKQTVAVIEWRHILAWSSTRMESSRSNRSSPFLSEFSTKYGSSSLYLR